MARNLTASNGFLHHIYYDLFIVLYSFFFHAFYECHEDEHF